MITQWTDELIKAKAEAVPVHRDENETSAAIAEAMRELRDEMQAEINTLKQELIKSLEWQANYYIANGYYAKHLLNRIQELKDV